MSSEIPAHAPLCAAADPAPRAPQTELPKLSCDSHMHICGPISVYDYAADRIYTPPDALLDDYLRLSAALGLQRVVFVQPSIYGTDNAAMLDAMRDCHIENRGIAVVDASVSRTQLQDLNELGVRGIRFNLVDVAKKTTQLPIEPIRQLADRIEEFGWHIELLIHVDDHPNLDELFSGLPVDLVVGHLGYFRPQRRTDDEGFRSLCRLMQSGRAWTKLTGPYRVSTEPLPYSNVEAFARTLVQEAPERVIWGSDWPHVMMKGEMPNDGDLLDLLFDWVPDAAARQRILVDNAAELYDF
ncbi:MAG: amidohydrolase family protein [Candidatus Rariloculaceae bacterium]